MADPDNRESLTAVETVCADGTTIPPILILKGDVLLEKYFGNDLENETLLATSPSGYSNEGLAMKYLIHFHNNTYKATRGKWRMLIFDDHRSHVSESFLHYSWQHRIMPFQLPPYSTHLLQLLDIGVFQSFKYWHQIDIQNTIQYDNCEYARINFLNAYCSIRYATFRPRIVKSAWKKAGLEPFCPQAVYDKMAAYQQGERGNNVITEPEPPKTPITSRPFQNSLTTVNRQAYSQYLDIRLIDYIDRDVELTPSFTRS